MKNNDKIDLSGFDNYKLTPDMRELGESFAKALNHGVAEAERKRRAQKTFLHRLLNR